MSEIEGWIQGFDGWMIGTILHMRCIGWWKDSGIRNEWMTLINGWVDLGRTTCVGVPGCPPSVLPSSIYRRIHPPSPATHQSHHSIPSILSSRHPPMDNPPIPCLRQSMYLSYRPPVHPSHASHNPRNHAVTQPSNIVDHPSCSSSPLDSNELHTPRARRPINQSKLIQFFVFHQMNYRSELLQPTIDPHFSSPQMFGALGLRCASGVCANVRIFSQNRLHDVHSSYAHACFEP